MCQGKPGTDLPVSRSAAKQLVPSHSAPSHREDGATSIVRRAQRDRMPPEACGLSLYERGLPVCNCDTPLLGVLLSLLWPKQPPPVMAVRPGGCSPEDASSKLLAVREQPCRRLPDRYGPCTASRYLTQPLGMRCQSLCARMGSICVHAFHTSYPGYSHLLYLLLTDFTPVLTQVCGGVVSCGRRFGFGW